MTFFRSDRSVEDLARSWNAMGPYRWEIRDSHDRGDYLLAVGDGHKVKVFHDPPHYEIDVIVRVGATKAEEEAWRNALDAAFRNELLPAVGGTVER